MAEQHLFSTGVLSAYAPASALANGGFTESFISHAGGTPPGAASTILSATKPANNIISHASTGDASSAFDWIEVDLGGSFEIAGVSGNAGNDSGAAISIRVWGATSTGIAPRAAGATLLGTASNSVSMAAWSVTPAEVALYAALLFEVVDTAGGGTSQYALYNLVARGSVLVPFAAVQQADIQFTWTSKELFSAANVSEFPVDVGFDGGMFTAKVGNVGVRADALQLLIASQLSGTTTLTDTLPSVIAMPPLFATFNAVDTSGNPITFQFNSCRAKGVQLPFKLNDFVVEQFELTAFPDSNGIVGTVVFG